MESVILHFFNKQKTTLFLKKAGEGEGLHRAIRFRITTNSNIYLKDTLATLSDNQLVKHSISQ